MAAGEHPNCQAVEDFLAAFKVVSRPIASTERINGQRVANGYTASYFDQKTGLGFTAIAWGDGLFKVILEAVGKAEDAGRIGALIAPVIEPQ